MLKDSKSKSPKSSSRLFLRKLAISSKSGNRTPKKWNRGFNASVISTPISTHTSGSFLESLLDIYSKSPTPVNHQNEKDVDFKFTK
jgi:hypothetical protein